jgi:hypothetical protein
MKTTGKRINLTKGQIYGFHGRVKKATKKSISRITRRRLNREVSQS